MTVGALAWNPQSRTGSGHRALRGRPGGRFGAWRACRRPQSDEDLRGSIRADDVLRDRRLGRGRSRRGLRFVPQQLQGAAAQERRGARRPADAGGAAANMPQGCRSQHRASPARRGCSSRATSRRSRSRRSARRTASSPATTSRSSRACASRPRATTGRSIASRQAFCLAGKMAGRRRAPPARRKRARKSSWRSTTAPRSMTACSPGAIWKSAG